MDPNLLHPETLNQAPPHDQFPPSETPNEIEETKKVSKRIVLLALLFLLIFVPLTLFLYGKYKSQTYKSVSVPTVAPITTPTPDLNAERNRNATANWQKYQGKNFSVSIPPGWKQTDDPRKFNIVFEERVYSASAEAKSSLVFQVTKSIFPLGNLDKSQQNLILDSNPAVKILNTVAGQAGDQYQISLFSNYKNQGYYIELVTSNTTDKQKEADEIIKGILSTFKFTNSPSPSVSPQGGAVVGPGCKLGGCSSEICQNQSDEPVVSTCIYQNAFACYKTARCEKQSDSKCGWSKTAELTSCLSSSK